MTEKTDFSADKLNDALKIWGQGEATGDGLEAHGFYYILHNAHQMRTHFNWSTVPDSNWRWVTPRICNPLPNLTRSTVHYSFT